MNVRYEVDELNHVRAWNDDLDQDTPFLYQPTHPDGREFESREDAISWAESWYKDFTAGYENSWYQNMLAVKEIAIEKVLSGQTLSEEEAFSLTVSVPSE